jgi:hypothetical protein
LGTVVRDLIRCTQGCSWGKRREGELCSHPKWQRPRRGKINILNKKIGLLCLTGFKLLS